MLQFWPCPPAVIELDNKGANIHKINICNYELSDKQQTFSGHNSQHKFAEITKPLKYCFFLYFFKKSKLLDAHLYMEKYNLAVA